MRLVDLNPRFIRVGLQREGAWDLIHVPTLAMAQGIRFDCPLGEGHWVVVWFAGREVPAHHDPDWHASGTGYADLTLSPSVNCTGSGTGCQWHGLVTNGDVT